MHEVRLEVNGWLQSVFVQEWFVVSFLEFFVQVACDIRGFALAVADEYFSGRGKAEEMQCIGNNFFYKIR